MWMKIEIEIFWCFFVNLYFWTYDISSRTFCSLPLSRKVNMTQNWLNTIFCGIYNFSSENGAAFSQNWLINISVRYVATIIQVSSEIPPPFIIIVQFWKRSLSSLPDPIIVCPWSFIRSLLLLRQWWCDSGWEEETNLILNNFSMTVQHRSVLTTCTISNWSMIIDP